MRAIYTAPTVEAAEVRFAEFADAWRATYPAMISSWENAWGEFVPFPRVPDRAPQDRLHHQRDREPQRSIPHGGPTPRALPERASRIQGPLPRRHDATEEP